MKRYKKIVNVILLLIVLCGSTVFSTACGKYGATDESAVVGTWRLTKYISIDNGDRTNIKKEYDFFYFVFKDTGKGYMKYKEKSTDSTVQVNFSYECTLEDGKLVSVSVATAETTTSFDFTDNFLQKGTLTYIGTSETAVTLSDGSTETLVYKKKMVLSKFSNDIDVI